MSGQPHSVMTMEGKASVFGKARRQSKPSINREAALQLLAGAAAMRAEMAKLFEAVERQQRLLEAALCCPLQGETEEDGD